jgi:hypothetical protein
VVSYSEMSIKTPHANEEGACFPKTDGTFPRAGYFPLPASIRGLELEVKLLCHTLTVGGVRLAEMADLATDDVFRHAPI